MDLISVNDGLSSENKVISKTSKWLKEVIANPNVFGTKRPVCPRSVAAIRWDRILLFYRDRNSQDQNELELLEKVYHQTNTGEYGYSILFVYDEFGANEITQVCHEKKLYFLEKKLLVGKFHPEITMKLLDNAEIEVPCCPYPIIAIRELVKEDKVFVDNQYTKGFDTSALIEAIESHFK